MNSFLKGFLSLFDWMSPKTLDEGLDDLDNSMKDLYDRMGWGKYPYPNNNCSYHTAVDINRVLEAEQSFMDEIYAYNTRKTIIKEYHKPQIKDPSRPRINKYL
jgi:hypothetical protein